MGWCKISLTGKGRAEEHPIYAQNRTRSERRAGPTLILAAELPMPQNFGGIIGCISQGP